MWLFPSVKRNIGSRGSKSSPRVFQIILFECLWLVTKTKPVNRLWFRLVQSIGSLYSLCWHDNSIVVVQLLQAQKMKDGPFNVHTKHATWGCTVKMRVEDGSCGCADDPGLRHRSWRALYWCACDLLWLTLHCHRHYLASISFLIAVVHFVLYIVTEHTRVGLLISKAFAILLKDTVCLFRIYVNQSGNKGMSISQTWENRKDPVLCLVSKHLSYISAKA